jgi:MGT family glycosyltransferase
LPDWWSDSTAPLVYLTFGTVFGHMSFAGDVLRSALAAVGELDARVLLTVGRKFDVSQLGFVPRNTHVEAWVDQQDVFAMADVVVCHGGSGTSLGALGAGLPLVIHPMFADQFVNAETIAATGACEIVKSKDSDATTIAIKTVLADTSYQNQTRLISEEIASMPDPADVLEQVAGSI